MMGQPVKQISPDTKVRARLFAPTRRLLFCRIPNLFFPFQLDLDNIWTFLFGMPAGPSVSSLNGKVVVCSEAVTALLGMVRAMLNQENKK